jgi:hypothetical protein
MATYPGGIKSFSTKTDGVSEVMSSDVNEPQDEITAVETELGIDVAGTATDLVTRLARSLSGTGNLDFASVSGLTIATGSVTPTQNWHTVDTESATATDDLDTIVATNATDGFMLFLRQSNNARDVTIKHNTGNIYCPGSVDIVLTDTTQVVAFIYDGTLSKWLAAVCPANVGLLNGANTWTAANIFSKALNFAYTSVTADTTLDATHFFVDVNATSDSLDITLPTVVGINGREYIIRKLDASANTVTITPDGTETINGSSDAVLDEQYETAIIFSNGASDWMLLATGGGGGSSSDLIEHTHTGSTDGGLLRLDTIAAPTDTTTRDSSTDAHGLLPKLDGISTNFLNGTGAWSAPAGGSSDITEHTHADSDTGGLIRLDTIAAPTDSTSLNASTDLHGLLPKLSGTVTEFMNGQGAWSTPSGSSTDLTEHNHSDSDTGGLIRLDTIAAPTDSTSLDASTDAHGLLPKLSGSSDQYMNGIGEWATVISGGGGASSDLIEHGHTGSTDGGAIKLDALQPPDDSTSLNASTDTHGLLPKLSGGFAYVLHGDGNWASYSFPSVTDVGVVYASNSSDIISGTTDPVSGLRFIAPDNLYALMRSSTTDFDASTDTHGFLPMLSGTSDNFLNGRGEWIIRRELLTANRTYYVMPTSDGGSSDNTGLTSDSQLDSVQTAIDYTTALDCSIYDVTIQIADGTYIANTITCKNIIGSGTVTIQGNSGTPANVVIDGGFYKLGAGTKYIIKDLKLIKASGTAATAIQAVSSALMSFSNLTFSTGYTIHIQSTGFGSVTADGNYTIAGNATYHWIVTYGGYIGVAVKTITISGTPSITIFAYARNGTIYCEGNTYNSSSDVVGQLYNISLNGVVYSSGVTLPGNSAGAVATGGQYA